MQHGFGLLEEEDYLCNDLQWYLACSHWCSCYPPETLLSANVLKTVCFVPIDRAVLDVTGLWSVTNYAICVTVALAICQPETGHGPNNNGLPLSPLAEGANLWQFLRRDAERLFGLGGYAPSDLTSGTVKNPGWNQH